MNKSEDLQKMAEKALRMAQIKNLEPRLAVMSATRALCEDDPGLSEQEAFGIVWRLLFCSDDLQKT